MPATPNNSNQPNIVIDPKTGLPIQLPNTQDQSSWAPWAGFGAKHPVWSGLGTAALGVLASGAQGQDLAPALVNGGIAGIQAGIGFKNQQRQIANAVQSAVNQRKVDNMTGNYNTELLGAQFPNDPRIAVMQKYPGFFSKDDKAMREGTDQGAKYTAFDPSKPIWGQVQGRATAPENTSVKQGYEQYQTSLDQKAGQLLSLKQQYEAIASSGQSLTPEQQANYQSITEELAKLGQSGAKGTFATPLTQKETMTFGPEVAKTNAATAQSQAQTGLTNEQIKTEPYRRDQMSASTGASNASAAGSNARTTNTAALNTITTHITQISQMLDNGVNPNTGKALTENEVKALNQAKARLQAELKNRQSRNMTTIESLGGFGGMSGGTVDPFAGQ